MNKLIVVAFVVAFTLWAGHHVVITAQNVNQKYQQVLQQQ